jgi:hypothetical protein
LSRACPMQFPMNLCRSLHGMVMATSGSANSVRHYYSVYRLLASLDVTSGSSCSPARR